jgi:hypothetical protein
LSATHLGGSLRVDSRIGCGRGEVPAPVEASNPSAQMSTASLRTTGDPNTGLRGVGRGDVVEDAACPVSDAVIAPPATPASGCTIDMDALPSIYDNGLPRAPVGARQNSPKPWCPENSGTGRTCLLLFVGDGIARTAVMLWGTISAQHLQPRRLEQRYPYQVVTRPPVDHQPEVRPDRTCRTGNGPGQATT